MERKVILSILRNLKVVRFEENAKYGFLGNLFYEDYVFGVYLFKDSVGQYICLEYIVNNVSDIEDTLKSIEERVIAGKYIVKGTDIILQTFFPVLFEETFFERQVNNSMSVLQRMIHICRH
ncbi:MAG: hypothetical protein UHP25_05275 [Prevotella sp.]|nr:hypothetical protein [Prevotella sp.]